MGLFPLVGLRRLTKWNPRESNPAVTFVSRVLGRLMMRSIRATIASNACSARSALRRQTRMAASA
jgi:hypothetical protein